MNLYQVKIGDEFIVLQHEHAYSAEGFESIVNKVKYNGGRIIDSWTALHVLMSEHGFKRIPYFDLS